MWRIKALSFFVDGECFAVDVSLVQKVVSNMEFTPVPTAPAEVLGIANLKGMVVSVLGVSALLEHTPAPKRRAAASALRAVRAIIFKPVAGEGDTMGLVVGSQGDLLEFDADRLMPAPQARAGGIRIEGVIEVDGTLCQVIDARSIVERFKEGGVRRTATEPQGGTEDEKAAD